MVMLAQEGQFGDFVPRPLTRSLAAARSTSCEAGAYTQARWNVYARVRQKHGAKLYEAMVKRGSIRMDSAKPVESLDVADLSQHPIWRFVIDDSRGETMVVPVKRLPARSLTNKVIGVQSDSRMAHMSGRCLRMSIPMMHE